MCIPAVAPLKIYAIFFLIIHDTDVPANLMSKKGLSMYYLWPVPGIPYKHMTLLLFEVLTCVKHTTLFI